MHARLRVRVAGQRGSTNMWQEGRWEKKTVKTVLNCLLVINRVPHLMKH